MSVSQEGDDVRSHIEVTWWSGGEGRQRVKERLSPGEKRKEVLVARKSEEDVEEDELGRVEKDSSTKVGI